MKQEQNFQVDFQDARGCVDGSIILKAYTQRSARHAAKIEVRKHLQHPDFNILDVQPHTK